VDRANFANENHSFYTLAAKRDLIPVLQEDIEQALAESDGVFTNLAMQNMKKLDSFMKETLRFYPLGAGKFVLPQIRDESSTD
jgi:hypothetical protein